MSFWAPPPPPSTKLGLTERFALAGIHVSPLQLGAMSVGKWGSMGMGDMDKESSFKLLDAYFDNGGNFIDTANNYQDESSETFVGEWAEQRNIRDQLVIATKYTTNFKTRNDAFAQKISYVGNNIKSMHISVEASLKKLRTTYIDILYLHWWDWDTGVEEVMNGLHNLVVQGKVLYLGVSDTPAWVVSQANQYARDHGKTPFVIYQASLALAPWGVIGQGKFRTDAEEEERRATGEKDRALTNPQWERNDNEKKISYALEKVAAEVGTKSITAVAIAYAMQKVPYCFPIIGGRKVEHLMANVEALDISLSDEQIAFLEGVVPFDPGFPITMIGDGSKTSALLANAGAIVKQPFPQAIRPTKN
ncbi:NADP-dependent oxidoreductase domain-containing protein [Mycena alexandri]|uniref:NADP-dependent oxidoreductase domain-containing protein n=1 Tax=Mycena alexandri TaxID=1745969 RepID=A0AAD6SRQ8_9AGAR|nr:NADP-dependent oxidoreductase domain-containing protein [Mycena alexandri]